MHEREATGTVSLFSFLKPLPLKLQSTLMPYSTLLVHLKQTEKPQNQTIKRLSWYSKREDRIQKQIKHNEIRCK